MLNDPYATQLFPFEAKETELPNGLKVIILPIGLPDVVSLQICVQAGPRIEVDEGKSGFAHFFEHMMFRGTKANSAERQRAFLERTGTRRNAHTGDDFTVYHATFSKEDLAEILEMEADRFRYPAYSEEAFRTEARAVLGEYHKNSTHPYAKLVETQRVSAFTRHPYRHTVMGSLRDIEEMANHFEYSRRFLERWYRPEYTAIVLVGDVEPEETTALVERLWGGWERGSFTLTVPPEPPPVGPVYAHTPWPVATMPWISLAFHGPGLVESEEECAALDLLCDVAFGYTSEPYHRLVEKDRRVERLFTYVPCTADPGLFSVTARLKNTEDLPYVRDIILQGFWRAWATVRPRELGDAKANAYYRTARGFDGTESIAAVVSRFVGYRRSYATLNDYYRRYRAVTPDLLNEVATRYLTEDGLVITTVSHEAGHANLSVSRAADLQKTTAGSINVSVRPSTLPQLHVKLVFDAGSAYDPPGKEGLAALTASMIAQGGSLSQRYEEIKRGLLPIAGHFQVQADKEQVSFSGSIHSDNWECFLDLVLPMLLEPALRDEDFARVLDNQRRALAEDLRFNNDEELCRERLQTNVFTGTPYGHPTLGTLSGLDSVSLEDVRTHITSFYTRANLMVAATGALPAGLIGCLQQELGVLPEGRPPSRPEVSWLPSRALTVEIIEKPTNATTLCLGHAIEVTRAHPDFAPLWLAASWLGDHRSVVGRLFRRIRQARGLNYGAYAYIEAFPQAMFRLSPAAHSVRRAQIFEIWIRPVAPENAVMALKIALHELDDLIERGLSVESFETTKRYLLKTAPLLQGLQEQALGATMDSQWYGNRDATMAERLRALSVEDVNAAIRRHLSAKDLSVVITARDGAGLKEALLTERPSSLSYPEQKPIELLEEDQRIGSRRLHLTPEAITVTPAETVFD